MLPVIDAILETDRAAPVKQRHTAKRIFERLRAEHEYTGGLTVVKDYVRIARDRLRETFVPLSHPPAQVDFGEAVGVIGGVRRKMHFFCMDLPHSDAPFVNAWYKADATQPTPSPAEQRHRTVTVAMRLVTQHFAPSCFHSASTGARTQKASREGGF